MVVAARTHLPVSTTIATSIWASVLWVVLPARLIGLLLLGVSLLLPLELLLSSLHSKICDRLKLLTKYYIIMLARYVIYLTYKYMLYEFY